MNEPDLSTSPYKNPLRVFDEAGVRFIVVGAWAMRAYGASSGVSPDFDLMYADDADNLERLAAFLPTIHARVLGRPANDNFVITVDTLQKVRFLNLKTDLGDVDVMREIPGVESFAGISERAVLIDFGGFVVRAASVDDLIAMKRAANRPKDQAHLYELLALKKLIESETA